MSRPRYPTVPSTASPTRRLSSSRETEKYHSHSHSHSHTAVTPAATPAAYVLEWNAYTSRRRNLADVRDLRTELLRESPLPSSPPPHVLGFVGVAASGNGSSGTTVDQRLVVVSDGMLEEENGGVAEALRAAGGVDGALLECHREGRGYRGRKGTWWSWEFPEEGPGGKLLGMTRFGRVSMWKGGGGGASLLVLPSASRGPARRRGQQQQKHYGTVDGTASRTSPSNGRGQQQQQDTIETAIWDSLGGGDGAPALEETLADLVYERWARLLERSAASPAAAACLDVGRVTRALEVNLDCARVLEKQGRPLAGASFKDWEDLLSRAHRRVLLQSVSPPFSTTKSRQPRGDADDDDDDEAEQRRSLDRIAYLGGILLPVTVVSGVLSIEGDYGPEGGNFWVFWVAALVASVLTILVIHVDRVRSLQVWIEVAADTVLEGGSGTNNDNVGGPAAAEVVIRKASEGGDAGGDHEAEEIKAYRRRRLGWGGAMKQVSGYYRLRGTQGMEFRVPR